MTSVVLFIALLLGIAVGVFIGLVICANTDMGDLTMTGVGRDILKCTAIALVTAAAGVGLFHLGRSPRVFLALVPVYYIGLKLCWLEITIAEMCVIALSTIGSLGVVIAVAFKVLM